MVSSWSMFMSCCKSRLSALARSLFLSRRRWQEKYFASEQARREWQEAAAMSEARCQELGQRNQELQKQADEWQRQLAEPRPVSLPLGAAPPEHQYGANLIALSVNLGRELGVRRAQRAMKIFLSG